MLKRPLYAWAVYAFLSISNLLTSIAYGEEAPFIKEEKSKNSQLHFRPPYHIVLLLDLSEAFFDRNAGLVTEDFTSALNVMEGLVSGFIKAGDGRDQIWIIGFNDRDLDATQVLGPFTVNSQKLKYLSELFTYNSEVSDTKRIEKMAALDKERLLPLPTARSDGFKALSFASRILSDSASYSTSRNQIVLVTSGLLTCQRTFRSGYSEYCKEGKVGGCIKPLCESLQSERAYDAMTLAYRELIEVLSPKLEESKISVDSYLVGKRVLPHSLLFPNPDKSIKRCMNSTEIEESNYPSVLYKPFKFPLKDPNEVQFLQTFLRRDKDSFFIAPNIHLSHFSKLTSGRFFPVRANCPRVKFFGYRDLSKDTVWGGVDDICAWHQLSSTYANQPKILPTGQSSVGFRYLLDSEELKESGFTDNDGRLICETDKRPTAEWVKWRFSNHLRALSDQNVESHAIK